MSDVVAVGNNSSRDTQGAGWWLVVEDEVSVEWERIIPNFRREGWEP